MYEPLEFAEEYTRTEKYRLLALYLLAGGVIVLTGKGWLFPKISTFAAFAHCREVFGISGVAVLFYGLFLAMPLFCALVVSLTFGHRGYRILRDRQLPPVGEKVFRPTRITRGYKAALSGYLHIVSPLLFLAIAVWGAPQAQQLSTMPQSSRRDCASNPAVQGTQRDKALRSARDLER